MLGDVKPVGDGVSELRVDYGPGYRVYFVRRRTDVVILVCGGDKQTQARETYGGGALGGDNAAFNLTEDATMKLKTTPFDPADFLDTKESQIELLADAIDSGDSNISRMPLGPSRVREGWRRSRKRLG